MERTRARRLVKEAARRAAGEMRMSRTPKSMKLRLKSGPEKEST